MSNKMVNFMVKLIFGFALFGFIVFLAIVPGLLPFIGFVGILAMVITLITNDKKGGNE